MWHWNVKQCHDVKNKKQYAKWYEKCIINGRKNFKN